MSAQGYAIKDTKKWSDFDLIEYKLKTEEEYDVTIDIHYSGVCGSDLHTITGGWGDLDKPIVPGHEIIGEVKSIGSKVSEFKVGQRVGVGAQVSSCFECRSCHSDNENYCPKGVDTYNAQYPNGEEATGGYSTGVRVHERFVFAIPDALESQIAAPMLCAGITVFSPLVRNGCGPGKKVGIAGVGGLGHLGVMFAKALGAEVFAFTHSPHKVDEIKSGLGADTCILTSEKGWEEKYAGELDIIVSTVDNSEGLPITSLLQTLAVHGKLISVGLPDKPLPELKVNDFTANGCFFGSSHIGSKKEINQMLALAAEKGIKTWIQELPMSRAKEAVENVKAGKVKYRYVLKNDINK